MYLAPPHASYMRICNEQNNMVSILKELRSQGDRGTEHMITCAHVKLQF